MFDFQDQDDANFQNNWNASEDLQESKKEFQKPTLLKLQSKSPDPTKKLDEVANSARPSNQVL